MSEHGPAKLLLLVEDDELLSDTIVEVLSNFGYRVKAVRALGDASVFLHSFKPAAIITDFSLSDCSATTAPRYLRGFADGVPLVLMTGWRLRPHQCIGADAILRKPVKAELLIATIEDLIARQADEAPPPRKRAAP